MDVFTADYKLWPPAQTLILHPPGESTLNKRKWRKLHAIQSDHSAYYFIQSLGRATTNRVVCVNLQAAALRKVALGKHLRTIRFDTHFARSRPPSKLLLLWHVRASNASWRPILPFATRIPEWEWGI